MIDRDDPYREMSDTEMHLRLLCSHLRNALPAVRDLRRTRVNLAEAETAVPEMEALYRAGRRRVRDRSPTED